MKENHPAKKLRRKSGIPHYTEKLLIHLFSFGFLIANLIAFAILQSDIRAWTLGAAAILALYAIVFLFDKRKHEWEWWCIVFGVLVALSISVCYTLLFKLYFYFLVIAAEILLSAVLFRVFKNK